MVFLAIFLLTQRKQRLSAMQLSRDLGVKYDTAWRIKHKLMQVMLERGQKDTLGNRVEIDDAYLGGEMPGKRGRGAHHKTPFIAAVETTQDGRPMKVHLRRVGGFRQREIARYAEEKGLSDEYIVPTMDEWEIFPREAAATATPRPNPTPASPVPTTADRADWASSSASFSLSYISTA